MKYPSVCLIINILAIFVIFASADDSSDPDIKQVHSIAAITIKDSKKPPEEPDDSPLSADISFTDNEGNNIAEAEDGRSITLDIKVKTDKKYKEGKVMECEIYETANTLNRKHLYDECSGGNSIEKWTWDQENQEFKTNFQVMKPPGSKSNEVTIECSAIVCKENCPPSKCPKPDSRRKRRVLFRKNPCSVSVRTRTNG